MADLNELFATLEGSTAGDGAALKSRQEGDAGAGVNGAIGFSFKDSSGDVILPSLLANGAIPVAPAAKTCLSAKGELAAGSGTLADVTAAFVVATLGQKYGAFEVIGSCTKSALFQLVHVDDVGVGDTETILGEFITGSGAFSFKFDMKCLEHDTTGGTGVQHYKVVAKNFNALSSLRATIACEQV